LGVIEDATQMKKQLFCFGLVIFVFTMGMTSVQSAASLRGTMELRHSFGPPNSQGVKLNWVGHITIDGVEYGMLFYNHGTGKPFNTQNPGNNVFFGEKWYIYESIDFQFDDQGVATILDKGPVLLSGNDQGVVSLANFLYRMNGQVEVANGIFQDWLGYHVHMSGEILFANGAPSQAPGVFQID
jgi:hypothetical protein